MSLQTNLLVHTMYRHKSRFFLCSICYFNLKKNLLIFNFLFEIRFSLNNIIIKLIRKLIYKLKSDYMFNNVILNKKKTKWSLNDAKETCAFHTK